MLRDRGIWSGVQITFFLLSVCRVRRVVEIVDSYPCDHCNVMLIKVIKTTKSLYTNSNESMFNSTKRRAHGLRVM